MIIAIASLKGGCSKTTTAIHLAAYLQSKAPTLLIDADKNRSALTWAKPEKLSFKVVSETAAPKYIAILALMRHSNSNEQTSYEYFPESPQAWRW